MTHVIEWQCGFCDAKNASAFQERGHYVRTCHVCGLIPVDAYALAREIDKQIEEEEDMEWLRAAN